MIVEINVIINEITSFGECLVVIGSFVHYPVNVIDVTSGKSLFV